MPGLAKARPIIVLRILLYFQKQWSPSSLKKDFWKIWKVKENPLSQSNTFSTRSLRCSWHGRCEGFSKSWERLKVGWKICSSQLPAWKRFPLLNSSRILASLANEGKVLNLLFLKLIWKTNNEPIFFTGKLDNWEVMRKIFSAVPEHLKVSRWTIITANNPLPSSAILMLTITRPACEVHYKVWIMRLGKKTAGP